MNGDPVIDPRTGERLIQEAQALRVAYTPEWTAGSGDSGETLISIFARVMEILISRLNKTPEKNFLAFLDTAGVYLLPPKAARVPIKFVATAGAKKDGKVPAGTQVATTPQPDRDPQIFETENDLTVSRAHLLHVFVHDPAEDRYADHSAVVASYEKNEIAPFQPFAGATLIPHRLYLSQDILFQIDCPTSLTISFTLDQKADKFIHFFKRGLRWTVALTKTDITPPENKVQLVGNTIIVKLDSPLLIQINKAKIGGDGTEGCWLRAEAINPLSADEANLSIKAISITSTASNLKPSFAFFNSTKLDIEREFYPFGERPKTFDTFFLAVPEAFAKEGSSVTLLFHYQKGTSKSGLALAYEFWNGSAWCAPTKIKDYTEAYTADPEGTGKGITFTCPAMTPTEVNGKKDYWLRVRITQGNYGEDAKMALKDEKNPPQNPTLADWLYMAADFDPPIITSILASYVYEEEQVPTAGATENNFSFASADLSEVFRPFATPVEDQAACYFSFDSRFSGEAMNIFFCVEETMVATGPLVVWEYWDGARWKNLGAQDGTKNLTESGIVEFIGPADGVKRILFNKEAYWLRARLERGEKSPIRICGIYLNTVWAGNTVTIRNELLGSSTETPGETFTLSRTPVLDGLQLEVLESERPSEEELSVLLAEEGEDAGSSAQGGADEGRECWVRWHRVNKFTASGEKSRHYIVDWFSGVVMFGNGVHGLIPPAGKNNIRAKWYQSGGGSKGNVANNTVAVLKRAIPFIDRAFNVDRAGGGSDGETVDHVRTRGPQALKTRGRAVTWEDYEWLAREASFQVARARCLQARSKNDAGKVRIILVPWSDDPKPFPSQGLIRLVNDYICARARRIATAELTILGPKYVEISISASVFPERLEEADLVRRRVKEALTRFFHPLQGGPDGKGWEFGRSVFVSEVCKIIEDTDGVDHAEDVEICPGSTFYASDSHTLPTVHSLTQVEIGDEYLVASGDHRILINGISEPDVAAFLGNSNTKELHNLRNEQVNCQIDEIRNAGHARLFSCLGRPIREGYDFCAYCFGRNLSQRKKVLPEGRSG